MILKKGEARILDHIILVEKDVYYFAKKEDLENSKLYIETNSKNNICNVYIISKSTEFLGSFSFYIVDENKNFIDEFISCIRNMVF